MKRLLKAIFVAFLALAAYGVVRRYKPKIVMVTGSVGKTSTKDAVGAVLSQKFFVRKSEKSFNSEFGVPFTILDVENPWENVWKWLGVFRSALALLILPNHYPSLLVLEVGADHPGDLTKILRIVSPDSVVVTRLPDVPVHVEAYASPEALRQEEFSPAYALPPGAPLVIPSDDSYAREMAVQVPARVLSYGFSHSADVSVRDIDFLEEGEKVVGMQGILRTSEGEGILTVRGSVGRTQLLPAAAAVAVGLTFGVSLEEARAALDLYDSPPGRGRIFMGKNRSTLIDDSYNASPAAVEEALLTLRTFPNAKRRIFVAGDMLELGRHSVSEHERVGKLAASSADVVMTVGIRSRSLAESARAAGCESVFTYTDSTTSASALSEFVQPGDVVLVKGSQSMRMERITEMLLAFVTDITRLPRQEKQWKRKA